MEEPSQLRIFISPLKDKESWESALSRFPQTRAGVSDGDRAIEANVKELVWDYGEAGYQIGLEIGKGLEYIRTKGSGLEIPQTTSLLERDIKEFRRRVRPMDGFFSDEGARNFSAIWVKMRNLQRQGVDWLEGIMKEAV
jgi:hypothetical protein